MVRRSPADHAGPGPAGPRRERVLDGRRRRVRHGCQSRGTWPGITTASASTSSAEAIELARRRFPGRRFLCGQGPADLAEAMRNARLVLLMDVLEHVPDDFAFLSGLLAASAPGTDFLVTVPANPSFWSAHDESNGHYRRYDMNRFQRLWAGLPVTTRLLSHYNARLYHDRRSGAELEPVARPRHRQGGDRREPADPAPQRGAARDLRRRIPGACRPSPARRSPGLSGRAEPGRPAPP